MENFTDSEIEVIRIQAVSMGWGGKEEFNKWFKAYSYGKTACAERED